MLDGFPDRESETVSRLQPVVAPDEVLEPQALDGLDVLRQVGVSNLRHWRPEANSTPAQAGRVARSPSPE